MSESDRHVVISRDGRPVLDLWGRPGILLSVSAPPPRPGEAPVTHQFASATFLRPEHEGELGELLREATSLDAFLDAVRARDYEVEES
jgi:hypothetical protein